MFLLPTVRLSSAIVVVEGTSVGYWARSHSSRCLSLPNSAAEAASSAAWPAEFENLSFQSELFPAPSTSSPQKMFYSI